MVARISGVLVRETLPDRVLELADEIELIDLPPEELIERLRQGKVYVADQVARAIQNFFTKGNLTALRELAMRVAADRVDAQLVAHMRLNAIAGRRPAQERILVCVNESPVSKALVRSAKRMAERARVGWTAVNVLPAATETLSEPDKNRRAEALRLADALGAEMTTLNAERDVADEIPNFARGRNVFRIVVGRPRRRGWFAFLTRESVADRLIRRAQDFEVTLVSGDADATRKSVVTSAAFRIDRDPSIYGKATVVVAVAAFAAWCVDQLLPVASLSLIFLTGVIFTASRFGLWPALYVATLTFLLYNFFFTDPRFTFHMAGQDDILTLVLYYAASILTGNLAAQLRQRAVAQRDIAERTNPLYDFSRKVASAASFDDVVWAAVTHVSAALKCDSILLAPDGEGRLEIAGAFPPEDHLDVRDRSAAAWAWERGEPAGWSSATLPSSKWLFLPLRTAQGPLGVLGITFADPKSFSPASRRLLELLIDHVAGAIERTRLVSDLEQSRVVSETERLRTALLSSVSHDLRTPLVSIIGAASSMLDDDAILGPDQRRQLAAAIREEGERLNRYIQNLLDMTRLGYGALVLNRQPTDVRELIGAARRQLGTTPDLVILDLGLPDMDGKTARIRGWSQVPVIVLSVRETEAEKVAALDAGAQDYVVKPFGVSELLARIRSQLRDHAPGAEPPGAVIQIGDLTIDGAARQVARAGAPVKLTRKEFDVLWMLASKAGRLVTHRMLLREIWGKAHEEDTHYLRVFVRQLRAKVGDDAANPQYIANEPGVGYRIIS